MKSKGLGEKLTELREERDLKQVEVIRAVNQRYGTNIKTGSYSKWENGHEEPSRVADVVSLAQFFGVKVEYLVGISDDKYNESQEDDFRKVPVLGDIAAGIPIHAQGDIIGYEIVNGPQKIDFCLHVKGDSMEGACIYDGDTVFIRKQPHVETGEIAAVVIDGEATLKRVYRAGSAVILRAENANYKDIVLSGKDVKGLYVAGKVVYVKSEVR